MSRTRRMLLIAALIVFGLIPPTASNANLTECGGPWQGTGSDMFSRCVFPLGGGALEVFGFASGPATNTGLKIELFRHPLEQNPIPYATCGGSGVLFVQCSDAGTYPVPPISGYLECRVSGVAVLGYYRCQSV